MQRKPFRRTRICVDYRHQNSVTQTDAYPMPRVDDIINKLKAAKYLTTLDLTMGYWQVSVAVEDHAKMAVVILFGPYHFKVMAFGL